MLVELGAGTIELSWNEIAAFVHAAEYENADFTWAFTLIILLLESLQPLLFIAINLL